MRRQNSVASRITRRPIAAIIRFTIDLDSLRGGRTGEIEHEIRDGALLAESQFYVVRSKCKP